MIFALQPLESIRADARAVYFVGGSATTPAGDRAASNLAAMEAETLRTSGEKLDAAWISVPEAVTFRVTPDRGPEPHMGEPAAPRDVHAFYYAPKNPDVVGSRRPRSRRCSCSATAGRPARPPTCSIWRCSSGRAAASRSLDVNYGGSTGYGRAYRERLKGQWGVVDVDDCVGGARGVVAQGKADPARLVDPRRQRRRLHDARGADVSPTSSRPARATTASATSRSLARDTHKFESRYLDTLIGPVPGGEGRLRRASPIHFTDRLAVSADPVPGTRGQGRAAEPVRDDGRARVREKGLPVAYLTFEGEQHGFRKAENIIRALEAELYFYGQVFRFPMADKIDPVKIDNPYR